MINCDTAWTDTAWAKGGTGAQAQGTWRSERKITWPEWYEMYRTLPHSQPIGLVQSAYVTCLLRGDSTKLVQHQHRVLYERQNAAALLGMHMYGFRVVLKDTFAPGDLDTVINQLVFRGQGDLEQFVDDRDLFVRVVGEIMTEFNFLQPPEAEMIGREAADGENKWILGSLINLASLMCNAMSLIWPDIHRYWR